MAKKINEKLRPRKHTFCHAEVPDRKCHNGRILLLNKAVFRKALDVQNNVVGQTSDLESLQVCYIFLIGPIEDPAMSLRVNWLFRYPV